MTDPHDESRSSEGEHREAMRVLQKKQREEAKQREIQRGVILIHTGDGKGKSSSAFGVALRAAGHGQKVGIVQFIKGTWKTGEKNALERFPEITHVVSGDGFTWNTQDRAKDIASARRGWDIATAMIDGSHSESSPYDVVILDELNVALQYDYLPVGEVVNALANKPEELSVIVTGRGAKDELIEIADTVTEMRPVKHAYDAGIRARKGIEF